MDLWQCRYNVILGKVEVKPKGDLPYYMMSDYELNNMIDKLDVEYGREYKPDNINSVLKSSFSQKYNPVKQYFVENHSNCDKIDVGGYIDMLANTVKIEHSDEQITIPASQVFCTTLKKWMVSSIANAFNDLKCENHTCPVFTGNQGTYKSTYINNLCPPVLRSLYSFQGRINLNPDNKDVLIMLAEKFTVNLDDQLHNLFKKDSETLKTILSLDVVSIRRPHAKFSEDLPRISNFFASINGQNFLTDESRRFLPFHVSEINIQDALSIDMNFVWEEAYRLYLSGYQWFWTAKELSDNFGDMRLFQQPSIELEMLVTYFEVPTNRTEPHTAMTQGDVINYLRGFTKENIRPNKLSDAIKKAGVIRYSARRNGTPIYVFALRKKDQNAIDRENDIRSNDPF